jgi:hypothetical protein
VAPGAPGTCDFWYELERTVRTAIATQKTLYCGYLKVRRDGAWLRIQLPSGRALLPVAVHREGKHHLSGR